MTERSAIQRKNPDKFSSMARMESASALNNNSSILKYQEIRKMQESGILGDQFDYQSSFSLPHLGGIKHKNKIMTYITEVEDFARQDLVIRNRIQTAILPPL
jgi:hypothetical protein